MKFKRFDKRLWPMLWLGLAIWLGSILILVILEQTESAPSGQGVLMDMAKELFQQLPIFSLLLLCLLQPVLEEFAFRLWGVGKLWSTIVSLLLMALFAFSEMGLWAVFFLGGFIFVWLRDKNELRRKWLLTLISSACFALCHVSGFGELSLGMVLGLTDIFGMAIVMCWLTLNLSIWFSALLHAVNNSLGVILPLFFLPDAAGMELPSAPGSEGRVTICIEPLRPFAFGYNDSLTSLPGYESILYIDSAATDFQLCGEPAEIAVSIARTYAPQYTYFDFEGKGESLEERVLFSWHSDTPQQPDMRRLLRHYLTLHKCYNEDTLIFDTAEVMLKEAYLIYEDGREELFDDAYGEDYISAEMLILNSGYRIVTEFERGDDSTVDSHVYCLPVPDPLSEQVNSYSRLFNRILPFRIEYRDARKATFITIKTK